MLSVFNTAEFRRIHALPRRPQEWSEEEMQARIEQVTELLKKPGGSKKLRKIQVRALMELATYGFLVGEIGAGQGKMLLSALVFTLLDAKRGLLLVPAHLLKQTEEEWEKWSAHFQLKELGKDVRVLSYSSLSTVRFANLLEEYQPDVIVADEAQALARMSSARTRRVFRYLRTKRRAGERCVFIPMSGTMKRKALRECAHLYEAALGDQSPIPTEYQDLQQWHFALDEGVKPQERIAPGALAALATEEELSRGLDGIRSAVRRRTVDAPGVVATSESAVDVPLIIRPRIVQVPATVSKAFEDLRRLYQLPDGDTFDGGVVAWAHARELSCGFTYRWDPPAPIEWMEARKAWNTFVREHLDTRVGGRHLDSPLQVWQAVERGEFGQVEAWETWRAIRHTFAPNPVPRWLDRWLVQDAEQWALDTGGIVWVGHSSAFTNVDDDDDLGQAFKRIPYFGGGKQGDAIRNYKGPCAASIRSHGTGKNLVQWDRALVMMMPSSGSSVEQLFARHQRPGQESDEVTFEFYCHSREQYQSWLTANAEARYAEAMTGNPQRILGATVLDLDEGAMENKMNDPASGAEWWPMGGW